MSIYVVTLQSDAGDVRLTIRACSGEGACTKALQETINCTIKRCIRAA